MRLKQKRTIKNCPRRKFTPRQLELLEKLHYLHVRSRNFDYETNEQNVFVDLFEKVCKFIY